VQSLLLTDLEQGRLAPVMVLVTSGVIQVPVPNLPDGVVVRGEATTIPTKPGFHQPFVVGGPNAVRVVDG